MKIILEFLIMEEIDSTFPNIYILSFFFCLSEQKSIYISHPKMSQV